MLKPNYTYIIVICLLSTAAIWIVANYHGLGLTNDSYYYLRLADDDDHWGYQKLYSFLISSSPFSPMLSCQVINLTCLLLTLTTWSVIIKKQSWDYPKKVFALMVLAFGLPHLLVSSFLWTEILFCFIFSLLLFLIQSDLSSVRKYLLTLPILLLLVWARKAGAIVCISFVLFVCIQSVTKTPYRYLIIGGYIVLLIFGWLYFYNGEPLKTIWIASNLKNNLLGIAHWFVPASSPSLFKLILLILLVISIRKISWKNDLDLFIIITFIIYFFIRLLVYRPHAEESDRYFAIFYAPLVYLAFQHMQGYDPPPKLRVLRQLLIVLFLIQTGSRSIYQSYRWNQIRKEKALIESTDNNQKNATRDLSLQPNKIKR